jgi:putative DNA primase/helicase
MIYTIQPYIFYLKSIANRDIVLEPRCEQDVMRVLKSIDIGSEIVQIPTGKNTFRTVKNKVSLKSLFEDGDGPEANKLKFLVRSVRFMSDDPNEFSYFRGYPWKIIEVPDYSLIQPFLDHIKNIICAGNIKVYNYLMQWISHIVQKPGLKTEKSPLIIGGQGSGKGKFFTEPIGKLFGRYALQNVSKIDDITGKFNTIIENKVFVVCNEMQSIENAKFLNTDSLKTIITDYDINYESKYVNKRAGENVANLIFVSNHALPIRLENDDRRYLVLKTSNEKCKDLKYFNKLDSVMKHELFFPTLFTLFMDIDIEKFQLENVPMTEAKEDIIEASKPSWQLFFEENIDEFVEGDGYVSKDCYADYQLYCKSSGYSPFSVVKFGTNIKKYVDIVKRKRNGKVIRYYKINCEGMKVYEQIQKEIDEIPDEAVKIDEKPSKRRVQDVDDCW